MDIGSLPDLITLTTHFLDAAQYTFPVVHETLEQTQNIMAAFGGASPLSARDKIYSAGKNITMAAIFGVSARVGNFEGMFGAGFAIVDDLRNLCHIGQGVRAADAPAKKI